MPLKTNFHRFVKAHRQQANTSRGLKTTIPPDYLFGLFTSDVEDIYVDEVNAEAQQNLQSKKRDAGDEPDAWDNYEKLQKLRKEQKDEFHRLKSAVKPGSKMQAILQSLERRNATRNKFISLSSDFKLLQSCIEIQDMEDLREDEERAEKETRAAKVKLKKLRAGGKLAPLVHTALEEQLAQLNQNAGVTEEELRHLELSRALEHSLHTDTSSEKALSKESQAQIMKALLGVSVGAPVIHFAVKMILSNPTLTNWILKLLGTMVCGVCSPQIFIPKEIQEENEKLKQDLDAKNAELDAHVKKDEENGEEDNGKRALIENLRFANNLDYVKALLFQQLTAFEMGRTSSRFNPSMNLMTTVLANARFLGDMQESADALQKPAIYFYHCFWLLKQTQSILGYVLNNVSGDQNYDYLVALSPRALSGIIYDQKFHQELTKLIKSKLNSEGNSVQKNFKIFTKMEIPTEKVKESTFLATRQDIEDRLKQENRDMQEQIEALKQNLKKTEFDRDKLKAKEVERLKEITMDTSDDP